MHLFNMATKTITITTEAYERLAALKGEKDSFSDTINKLTKKTSLYDLVGILSKEGADELKKNIKKVREDVDKRVMEVASKLR